MAAFPQPLRAVVLSSDLEQAVSRLETKSSAKRFENYTRMVARVVDVLGDEVKASRWLSTVSTDLEDETPLEYAAKSDYDVSVLQPLLIRLEHGIDF